MEVNFTMKEIMDLLDKMERLTRFYKSGMTGKHFIQGAKYADQSRLPVTEKEYQLLQYIRASRNIVGS